MSMTNRGAWLIHEWVFRGVALPTNFYVALIENIDPPSFTEPTMSGLSEIPTGNGYTAGGFSLAKNTTDFKSNISDAGLNKANLLLKDVSWTATGGPIPASGTGARFAVLTTDEVTIANRQVVAWWDLVSDRIVTVGQIFKLVDLGLTGEARP